MVEWASMAMISQGEPGHTKKGCERSTDCHLCGQLKQHYGVCRYHNNEEVETAILVCLRLKEQD